MSTVFEELNELEAQREAAFESIVEALVEGRTVDAQSVDGICRDAGKTARELASVVDKRKRLKARQAEVARLDDLVVERTDIQSQIDQANAELDQRVAEHQSRCLPLQHRIAGINSEMMRLSQLKSQLAAGQY